MTTDQFIILDAFLQKNNEGKGPITWHICPLLDVIKFDYAKVDTSGTGQNEQNNPHLGPLSLLMFGKWSFALGPPLFLSIVINMVEIVGEEWQHFKDRQVMILIPPAVSWT